jgi:hypothetical protein
MANLILTAVGTAVAGPIGGAVGALIGQQADQAVFAPKARHGPRLGAFSVQTSSYGTAIPKLFGTMRVAGTVIWATDLVEHQSRSGGGKCRPRTVNYAYSASFAVALSARPIRAVHRIWADGKLLRGAAGDWKGAARFRLHQGGEDQAVDPLIAAAEGAGLAPAYRGLAYAVFEDLPLEDYGNRIPSLTFEVEADAGGVSIGDIAARLSDGAIAAGSSPALYGYAASGDSVRGAIEQLAELADLSLQQQQSGLRLGRDAEPPLLIAAADETGQRAHVRRAAAALPAEISIVYHDPALDHQTGLQRAVRTGGEGLRQERAVLAAAVEADTAKAFAEGRLAALWAGRERLTVRLGWSGAAARPGRTVRIDGDGGQWRVARWTWRAEGIALELVRLAGAHGVAAAVPGRALQEPDLVHGPTLLRLYDLPLYAQARGRPVLVAAAAGEEPGWRSAALLASFDGGASWEEAGAAPPAPIGRTLTALPPAGAALIDAASEVEVELAGPHMWLEGRSDAALAGGANLALIGGELLQFGTAAPLGGRAWRLGRLLRGRMGTEDLGGDHAADEDFLLIDPARLVTLEPPDTSGETRVVAAGRGDDEAGVEALAQVTGEALRPPPPVHLSARREADGGWLIRWVRRSRTGWTWGAGEVPIGEAREAYRLTIDTPGARRAVELRHPAFHYGLAAQAEDGGAAAFDIAVVQIGSQGESRPARLRIEGEG